MTPERTSSENDHDLLIRIDTNLVAFNKAFREHTDQDAKEFGKIDLKLNAAHNRIDSFVRVRDMVISSVAVVSLIVGLWATFGR